MNYTSVDTIFYMLTTEKVDFNEEDAISMIGDALEGIGTQRMLEDSITFAEVKNHQCFVPRYTIKINQIARNNMWMPTNKCVTPQQVIQETPNIFYQTCSDCMGNTSLDMGYVVLDGKGSPLVEYDVAYYRPYFDLQGEYYGWSNSKYYLQHYTPVRLANSNFFNSIVDSNFDGSLYPGCKDEYTIVGDGTELRFSFREGFVAISTKRVKLDTKTGYPMIPDTYAHKRAIMSYIKFRKADIDLWEQREGAVSRRSIYEQDWQWYCGMASNQDKMLQGEDELQNLLDQRSYLLPDLSKYYKFFGNLNTPEYRKYNDPNHRNNPLTPIIQHG